MNEADPKAILSRLLSRNADSSLTLRMTFLYSLGRLLR